MTWFLLLFQFPSAPTRRQKVTPPPPTNSQLWSNDHVPPPHFDYKLGLPLREFCCMGWSPTSPPIPQPSVFFYHDHPLFFLKVCLTLDGFPSPFHYGSLPAIPPPLSKTVYTPIRFRFPPEDRSFPKLRSCSRCSFQLLGTSEPVP